MVAHLSRRDSSRQFFDYNTHSYFEVGEVDLPVAMAVQSCPTRGLALPDRLAGPARADRN